MSWKGSVTPGLKKTCLCITYIICRSLTHWLLVTICKAKTSKITECDRHKILICISKTTLKEKSANTLDDQEVLVAVSETWWRICPGLGLYLCQGCWQHCLNWWDHEYWNVQTGFNSPCYSYWKALGFIIFSMITIPRTLLMHTCSSSSHPTQFYLFCLLLSLTPPSPSPPLSLHQRNQPKQMVALPESGSAWRFPCHCVFAHVKMLSHPSIKSLVSTNSTYV